MPQIPASPNCSSIDSWFHPNCWWKRPYCGMLSSSTPLLRRYTCDQAPQGPLAGARELAPSALLMVYWMRIDEASTKSSPPSLIRTVRVPFGARLEALVG